MFLSTVTNKSSITDTTVESLTQFGYFSCSIHQVIWYLTSENPEICWKSLEVTSRKNGRFLELAQIGPFLMHGSFKHLICQPKKCIIHETLDQQLLLNHIIFICYPYNQYLTRLLYQIMFFSKFIQQKMGQLEPSLKICPFSWMLLLTFFNIFLDCLRQNIKCLDV